jgi:hypothetical protein
VHYFGDLDLAGLLTAANAAAQAAAAGLPTLHPASSCYRLLLDGPSRWRTNDASNQRTGTDYPVVCAWMPPALRPRAVELLSTRRRVPQERLGLKTLRRHPHLWDEFAAVEGL